MKPGRDWSKWNTYEGIVKSQNYIVRHKEGYPVPVHVPRRGESPMFTIKAWGTKGYK